MSVVDHGPQVSWEHRCPVQGKVVSQPRPGSCPFCGLRP